MQTGFQPGNIHNEGLPWETDCKLYMSRFYYYLITKRSTNTASGVNNPHNIIPLSHYRQYVLGYRCSSAAEPPPRSPHFVSVVHTTGCVIYICRCLVKCPCPSTTIEIGMRPCVTVVRHPCTSTHCIYRHVTPKDDRVTTLYTSWIRPSVTVARNHLCMLGFVHRRYKVMDGLPLTHKFANGDQTVIQGQEHFTKRGSMQVIPPVV